MDSNVMLLCVFLCLVASVDWTDCRRVKRQHYQSFLREYVPYPQAKPQRLLKKEERQDFSKIPGIPGVDYPIFHRVPETNFDCNRVPAVPGMYANIETGCQAYHVCNDGRDGHQGSSFLCTNGTLFNQKEFTCDWWYNVNCDDAAYYYSLNLDPLKNPYTKKQKEEELQKFQEFSQYYQQY